MIGFWIIENWIFDKGPDEEVKNDEEDEEDSYNDDDDEDLDTESYEYDDYMDDIEDKPSTEKEIHSEIHRLIIFSFISHPI